MSHFIDPTLPYEYKTAQHFFLETKTLPDFFRATEPQWEDTEHESHILHYIDTEEIEPSALLSALDFLKVDHCYDIDDFYADYYKYRNRLYDDQEEFKDSRKISDASMHPHDAFDGDAPFAIGSTLEDLADSYRYYFDSPGGAWIREACHHLWDDYVDFCERNDLEINTELKIL